MTSNDWHIFFDGRGKPYIEHYGINGQKWGVRNGPPYPLDFKAHSKAEQRLNPRRILGGKKANSKDSERKNEEIDIFGFGNKSNEQVARDVLKKNPNAAVADPDLRTWIKNHKKELLIGAGVVGVVAVGAIVASNSNVSFDRIANIDQQAKEFVDSNKIADQVLETTDKVKLLNNNGGFESNEERFVAQWLRADMHRFDAIKQEDYLKLSDDDGVTLEIGEKMFRMSKGEHSTLRDGIEYVSFGEDRDRYKGFLPQMWRTNNHTRRLNKFYESELSAKTIIKAPGKKESIELLEKALKSKYPNLSDEFIHKEVLNNFYKFQLDLADRDNKIAKLYFSEVQAKGFNAVIDFNDAGRLADKPLILLNGAKFANVDRIQEYSHSETRKILKDIKLPTGAEDFNIDEWNSEGMSELYKPYIKIYANA